MKRSQMLHIHYRFPHWNQQNSIIFRLVAKKTHAIQRKNPNIHQLLKKKKKDCRQPNSLGIQKKKKKQRERESQWFELGFDWTEKGNGLGIRVSKFTSYTNFLMYLFCRAREKQAGSFTIGCCCLLTFTILCCLSLVNK